MQIADILVIALALSLDAFAVSLAASASGHVTDKRAAFRLSFHFGLFQFLMPILGWVLGTTIEPTIAAFDHWIAFALLAFVGVRMITSAIKLNPRRQADNPSRGVVLVMLSTATSIDALAIGVSLAMLRMAIWYPSIVIGLVTAGMSVLAIVSGNRIGSRLGERAQLVGGVVLLLIGMRIVISHAA